MVIKHVGVIGAGQMGAGIAQVFAASGFSVTVHDAAEAQLEKAKGGIGGSLAKFVEKGKLSAEDRNATLGRLAFSAKIEDLAGCDFVVEAIVENLDVKTKIFTRLAELCRPDAILASNTSSLPITQLAAVVSHPERFIGMHFMNPVPLMQLVEVIRGLRTSDATHAAIMDLARQLGKTPVTVNDAAGFVSNRILLPMINEAFYALQEGVATAEDIDTVMKLGMNHPMGPLTLADFIGLDTCLAIMEVLHTELGDSKYRPCPLLRKYVRAGLVGKKCGEGVFKYAPAKQPAAV